MTTESRKRARVALAEDRPGVDVHLREKIWQEFERRLIDCDSLQSMKHGSENPHDREFSHVLETNGVSIEILFRHNHVQVAEDSSGSSVLITYEQEECCIEILQACHELLEAACDST